MLWALLLAIIAPCAAYVGPTAARIPQYLRLRAKTPRNLLGARLNAKLSRFDAFTAENEQALKDVSAFWAKQAKQSLHWSKPFASALANGFGSGEISWFKDGELNVCYNCLDRHLPHLADKPAVVFEGDLPEDTQTVTYGELHEQVCRLANLMAQHGVQKGDVVTTYMPTSPELVAVMLACARIGAVHNVVHTSVSPFSLYSRMNETNSQYVFTFDQFRRKSTKRVLKQDVAEAVASLPSVTHIFVFRKSQEEIAPDAERDVILNNVLHLYKKQHECVPVPAEHPLFVLYTTSTSAPHNGFVHSTGGYAVQAALSAQLAFDLQDNDIIGCLVDPGLIAGTTYSVYGPLLNGASTFLYGGAAGFPTQMRYLQMARRHKLTHLYATTTAFRLLKDEDPLELKIMKLPNLRVIGTLGEPVDEETYTWLRDVIGKGNCSVVTGWMQTQSGVLLCSGLPGVTPAKPATCGVPMPGVDLCLVDDNGNELTESPAEGKLLVKQPWPAMARGFFGNNARFEERYLKPFPGRYYTGDLGKRDEDGQYRVEGSVEDIINSGGYRVSCSELEAALSGLGVFNDTAVVGIPHNRIGQAICAFVVPGVSESEDEKPMTRKRAEEVASQAIKSLLGRFAAPDVVYIVPALPKAPSGEVLRSMLTKLALGELEDIGDKSILADKSLLAKLVKQFTPKKIVLKDSKTARQAKKEKNVKKVKKKVQKGSAARK